MDADFSSREVWYTPVLKRELGNGTCTMHFPVLEEVLDRVEPLAAKHEKGSDEKMAVGTKAFRRVGTGKVNHEDKDLKLMKTTETVEVMSM